jgi:c-di-GMP-binding flagellar brake protein YcgR
MPTTRDQRRLVYRAEVTFPITYMRDGGTDAQEASAVNVSARGVRFFTNEHLALGDLLDLTFTLPAAEVAVAARKTGRVPASGALQLKGRVAGNGSMDGRRWYGIEFLNIPEKQAEDIHLFVHLSQIPKH